MALKKNRIVKNNAEKTVKNFTNNILYLIVHKISDRRIYRQCCLGLLLYQHA